MPAFKAIKPLLDPAVLPSLRSFTILDLSHANQSPLLERCKLKALVPQLESINLRWRTIKFAPESIKGRFETTLFDCDSSDLNQFSLELAPFRHVRIMGNL